MNPKKQPKYKIIDIGNPSDPKEARYNKLLKQIPKGKAIKLIDENIATTPANKILVEVIKSKDIPPTQRPHNLTKATLIKAGFKHVTETNETKPKRTHKHP